MGTKFFSPKPMKKSTTRIGSSGHKSTGKVSFPKGGTKTVSK